MMNDECEMMNDSQTAREPAQDKTDKRPRPSSIPVYMRSPEKRFGTLSNRMSTMMVLVCRLCSIIGAVGWTMIIFSFLGWHTQFSGAMNMAGAAILAMVGTWCQYRLVLHGRACAEEEEAACKSNGQDDRHGFVPLPEGAHRPQPNMVSPLAKMRHSMLERLRKLHGHAEAHLRRFPSSDKLTPAEILSCVLFSIIGYWGGVYLVDFYQRPPAVIEFKNLAGACIAVTVGVFLALRLIMFIGLKLRSRVKNESCHEHNSPGCDHNNGEDRTPVDGL